MERVEISPRPDDCNQEVARLLVTITEVFEEIDGYQIDPDYLYSDAMGADRAPGIPQSVESTARRFAAWYLIKEMGLSYPETAEALGYKPPLTTHLSMAKRAMEKDFGPYYEEVVRRMQSNPLST